MSEPLIELAAVSRVYDMGGDIEVVALRDFELTVDRGDFVAIVGPSGSGKSTLMHILGCLDRPTSGTYRLDGVDVGSLDDNALAALRNRAIGFVFQSYNLLPRTTAQENVELPLVYSGVGRAERAARAARALQRVGLGDRLRHRPAQLSGGQQQRVAIARALVGRPKVILADEPTGALDSKTSVEVMALLQELGREGITIVLVTHEPDIASFASRVITMRDGKVKSDVHQTPHTASHPAEEASA